MHIESSLSLTPYSFTLLISIIITIIIAFTLHANQTVISKRKPCFMLYERVLSLALSLFFRSLLFSCINISCSVLFCLHFPALNMLENSPCYCIQFRPFCFSFLFLFANKWMNAFVFIAKISFLVSIFCAFIFLFNFSIKIEWCINHDFFLKKNSFCTRLFYPQKKSEINGIWIDNNNQ